MIDDGPAYKLLLQRAVKRFELDLRDWPWPPERAGDDWDTYWRVRFEDVLFRFGLGARKLMEAAKLSVEVQERPIDVTFLPAIKGYLPGAIDQHRIEDFFDAERARPEKLPILILCHAIVHSHVLVPRFAGTAHTGLRLEDFYLASDRGRKEGVYLINWRSFVDELVHSVTSDNIVGMFVWRLPDGEELRIAASSSAVSIESRNRLIDLYRGLSRQNAKSMDKFMNEWRQAYGLSPTAESTELSIRSLYRPEGDTL